MEKFDYKYDAETKIYTAPYTFIQDLVVTENGKVRLKSNMGDNITINDQRITALQETVNVALRQLNDHSMEIANINTDMSHPIKGNTNIWSEINAQDAKLEKKIIDETMKLEDRIAQLEKQIDTALGIIEQLTKDNREIKEKLEKKSSIENIIEDASKATPPTNIKTVPYPMRTDEYPNRIPGDWFNKVYC